jgi:prophage tail gpP-like protein
MFEIRFDGMRFSTWNSVELRESVDDLCASLRLAVAMPDVGTGLGLTANSVVTVWADDAAGVPELVTTVRLDSLRRSVGATSHEIAIEARSLGRELVDCQYSKTLSGMRLEGIIKALCKTFDVPVEILAKYVGKTQVVPEFAMQCELPANALINAARAANLLLHPLPTGGLLLTEPTDASAVATLFYGEQLKSYAVVDEYRLRFSDYVVKSFDYDSGAAPKGVAKDDGISFFRPMHLVADKHGHSLGACERRAQTERNRRQARAHRLSLVVQGWSHAAGLWRINTQVRVVIPSEDIDEVFLIGDRTFKFDGQGGQTTHIEVMPRNAFVGEPKAHKKRASEAGNAAPRKNGVGK